jgi:hypothetical protein
MVAQTRTPAGSSTTLVAQSVQVLALGLIRQDLLLHCILRRPSKAEVSSPAKVAAIAILEHHGGTSTHGKAFVEPGAVASNPKRFRSRSTSKLIFHLNCEPHCSLKVDVLHN